MIKKRYIVIGLMIVMFLLGSVVAYTKPVLPLIQLPGELYPSPDFHLELGPIEIDGLTNTFVATVLAWIIVLAIALGIRARSRTADEVPTGFYNLFEMLVEGMRNFAINLSGSKKAADFFPYFITFFLLILVANWMELIPGVDSVGFVEYIPHVEAVKFCNAEQDKALAAGESYGDEQHEACVHHMEEIYVEDVTTSGEPNVGYKDGIFIVRQPPPDGFTLTEYSEENVGYNLVPLIRAAATDLNFTLALSLVAMTMVQYYGFKYLGRRYLSKFFAFNLDAMAKSPIKVIDPFVGLLELVGEISRVISFAFRLLGNIFAGQILLFVMAFLLSVANIAFFGLEFFVGVIQAAVFGLLALIFMTQATESHDGHEEHH